ncbi:MAG: flagellar filament capping protein FliD [Oscillospiraceae bacterium]|nr:flagellar filament capping protein FliD [Oscillospiraceae bacterium]
MASISGVSRNNATSSLYNSANVISGLASGLDTEGMIESLVQSYQTKISQLNKQATKIEWKQDAYRDIISKMVGFSSKYTSYTSSTNLTSPSFFSNAVKVLTKGEFADSVSASGKTSSDIQINAVHQLATAAQYRTKSNMGTGTETGTILGKDGYNMFTDGTIETSNLSGSLTLAYGSKSVSISFNESTDVEAMKDIRQKLEKENGAGNVNNADVLAELINQKLGDQQIVFTGGNVESADKRIKATANSDGTISFEELGTAKNGLYISAAGGNIGDKLGLSENDLKNASEKKITSVKMSSDLMSTDPKKGLVSKMSGIEYLAEKSKEATKGGGPMNMSLNGSTKQITLPHVAVANGKYYLDGEEVKATTDEDGKVTESAEEAFVRKYTESLQKSVKDAFGDKVQVENKGTGSDLQLEFKVKEGDDLVINATVGDALGIGRIATSYLNTSKTLGDLLGEDTLSGLTPVYETDEKGEVKKNYDGNPIPKEDERGRQLYKFELNGVTIGEYTKDTTLATIMSDINSNSDAGVKVGYSQTTQSFTFTAKETGADSKIEFGDGLASAMFGSTSNTSGTKFGEAYGLDLTGGNKKVTFEFSNYDASVTVKAGDTMDDVVKKMNMMLQNVDYTASFNSTSGQIVVTDKTGKMMDFKVSSGGEEYKPQVTSSYTSGQDAIFTATVNGEQIRMQRSSNSVNIDGLTVNMKETFNSKENGKYEVDDVKKSVTFQNQTDSDKIIDAIKSMANDYNSMMSEIKKAYSTMPYQKSSGSFANYEPLTDDEREGMSESAIERYEAKAKQGILFGDRDLSNLYTKMSQVFTFNNTKDVDTLREMGIELTYSISEGTQTLKIDEDKLRAMLDSDPDRVSDIFTRRDGIMDRMKSQLDTYSKTTGEPKGILVQTAGTPLSSLSLMNNQWQKQIDNINTQIEKWQDKLSNQVDRYTSMFSRLEVLINQMNSQSSTLAGLMGG